MERMEGMVEVDGMIEELITGALDVGEEPSSIPYECI
jgi:hypothetical protein